jgi:hypothetical protein
MEGEFGTEIVRHFGARLQRIYAPEQTALPERMAQCLDRLKRRESETPTDRPQQTAEQHG